MPISGVKAVKANMKRIFKDISEKKAAMFVNTVLSIGENHSKELAPIEYSTLVNSVMKDVTISGQGVKGVLSYNTNYAAFLEFNQKWKPRPPLLKNGPAWNPKAEPHFLKKGFEEPESVASIKKAEDIFKV